MTSTTMSQRPVPAHAPFAGLLSAEWIKLRSLRDRKSVV